MGCLGAKFNRLGGDLSAQLTRESDFYAEFICMNSPLKVEFSLICGTTYTSAYLKDCNGRKLVDRNGKYIKVKRNL